MDLNIKLQIICQYNNLLQITMAIEFIIKT